MRQHRIIESGKKITVLSAICIHLYIYIYTTVFGNHKPGLVLRVFVCLSDESQVEANWPKAESILLALQKAAAPGHLWPGIVGDAQVSREPQLLQQMCEDPKRRRGCHEAMSSR